MPKFIEVPVSDVKPGDIMLYAAGLSAKVHGVSSDVDIQGCMACNTPPNTVTIDVYLVDFIHPFTFYSEVGQEFKVEVYR